MSKVTGQGTVIIGISSCLLGAKVRFDGGHKQDDFLVNTFGKWVQWVPVCPEVEVGMGTPRESIRLVREGSEVRLVAPKSGRDWTAEMRAYAERRLFELEARDLDGFVLKKDSPSCGMERVKVYGSGMPTRSGRGLFAEALLARWPYLPVEEEGRLNDPRLRDNFVERVFAYRRAKELFAGRWTVGQLVAFHTAHKLQLMAHSPATYQALGRLVANAKGLPRQEVRDTYLREFMTGLRTIATPRRHVNVLLHILGYFRKVLDEDARAELLTLIEDYRRGLLPLIVPITLIRHHVHRHRIAYLEGQVYLEPHPKELMLRNHV
jgi:uncharacterized protein YbgA (DUF1722 family)/uncharacterized protein YbbK (DUF523 family)